MLQLAGVHRARGVVVATNRDDTAVLVTLTARELASSVRIVAAVRANTGFKHIKHTGPGYRNHHHYQRRILLRSHRQTRRRRTRLNHQATAANCE